MACQVARLEWKNLRETWPTQIDFINALMAEWTNPNSYALASSGKPFQMIKGYYNSKVGLYVHKANINMNRSPQIVHHVLYTIIENVSSMTHLAGKISSHFSGSVLILLWPLKRHFLFTLLTKLVSDRSRQTLMSGVCRQCPLPARHIALGNRSLSFYISDILVYVLVFLGIHRRLDAVRHHAVH